MFNYFKVIYTGNIYLLPFFVCVNSVLCSKTLEKSNKRIVIHGLGKFNFCKCSILFTSVKQINAYFEHMLCVHLLHFLNTYWKSVLERVRTCSRTLVLNKWTHMVCVHLFIVLLFYVLICKKCEQIWTLAEIEMIKVKCLLLFSCFFGHKTLLK